MAIHFDEVTGEIASPARDAPAPQAPAPDASRPDPQETLRIELAKMLERQRRTQAD